MTNLRHDYPEYDEREDGNAANVYAQLEQLLPPYDDRNPTMKLTDILAENSKYLKKADVDDSAVVTIQALKKVNVARDDEPPEYKWTMKFAEFDKPLVMNVTNLKRAGKALGEDTADWLNKRIEIYVDPDIEFGGEVTGGLRLRALKRAPVPSKARNEDDVNSDLRADDPPF